MQIQVADVRDRFALRQALKHASQVFHFAAQVAVTTSLTNPVQDFEINALGTLNLLEEMRSLVVPPPLVFTSTNKVYGTLPDIPLQPNCTRYQPVEVKSGISEDHPLDFHSPYGCSKGAADQYVLDYARTFGIPAVVFRMSCIYGPHQFGTEDQGWVAHFLIRAIDGQPVTLYGDGMQRDIKFGVQTRIDLWTPPLLELLGRAGCVSIEAGVESITEQGRQLKNWLPGMHRLRFMRYPHVMNLLVCRCWKRLCRDARWYWGIFRVCGRFGGMPLCLCR